MLSVSDVYAKYGDVEMKFTSYYKYEFCFEANVGGITFRGRTGGGPSDIYKLHVTLASTVLVGQFQARMRHMEIWDGSGIIFDWHREEGRRP